jgi:hypothetical protein
MYIYVSDKRFRENQNEHILSSGNCLRNSCRLWDNVENMVQPDSPQMTIRRMRIASWVTNATDTHSEHVLLIDFPGLQCLQERVSVFLYTYIAYLVSFNEVQLHNECKSCVFSSNNFSVTTCATADYHTQNILHTLISWNTVNIAFLHDIDFSRLI